MVITEIGGTVGDIEGMPFFEAIRQFALDVGKHNCLFIHLTLVPYLKAAGELKTKPTQHSVGELRKIGIQPDVLICRTEREIPKDECEKIALFCNVERRAVIEEKDKEFSIYEVPLSLADNKLDELIVEKLGLTQREAAGHRPTGGRCSTACGNPAHEVTIGVRRQVREAPRRLQERVRVARPRRHRAPREGASGPRIESEKLEREGAEQALAAWTALLVPGGFDKRGIEGKIEAIRYARENGAAVLRHLPGAAVRDDRVRPQRRRAGRTRTAPSSTSRLPHPVVCLLDEQQERDAARRDDAAGRVPVPPGDRHEGARGVRQRT